jgi:hypothetical protein
MNWNDSWRFPSFAEVDAAFMGYNASRRHCMSKAAVTHTFRKLKTPSRCRECDSYVYFQGAECIEVKNFVNHLTHNLKKIIILLQFANF